MMTEKGKVLFNAFRVMQEKTKILVNKTADLLEVLHESGISNKEMTDLYQYILIDTNLSEMLEEKEK